MSQRFLARAGVVVDSKSFPFDYHTENVRDVWTESSRPRPGPRDIDL